MSADKNPTINALRQARAELEEALEGAVRELTNAFWAKTGVSVTDVHVDFGELSTVGRAPQTIVYRVRVALRL